MGYLIRQLILSPVIVIDIEGIRFHNRDLISWEVIGGSAFTSYKGQGVVYVWISEEEKFIAATNGLRRLVMKMYFKMYGTPIVISCAMLDISSHKLRELIDWHRDSYFEKHPSKREKIKE
jgi:hypothetical protein